MFSNNGKISIRQVYRLFLFDFLGVGSLVIPTILARLVGSLGWLCIILGIGMGLVFLALIAYEQSHIRTQNMVMTRIINIVVGVQSILACAFCSKVFVDLVRFSLIPEEKYWLILVIILLTSFYSIKGGIESRARVYEVLFWFVIIPLVIMVVGAIPNIELSRLSLANFIIASEPNMMQENYGAGVSGMLGKLNQGSLVEDVDTIGLYESVRRILEGSYIVFVTCTTLIYVLFLRKSVEKSKQQYFHRAIAKALIQNGVILLVIYLVLVGNFGVRSLSNLRFPIVTLMSTVQITGSFFKRTDALMMGIWFFTMFAIVNINLFYACRLLNHGIFSNNNARGKSENEQEKSRKWTLSETDAEEQSKQDNNWGVDKENIVNWFVLAVVFAISLIFNGQEAIMNKYLSALLYFIVPVLVFIPVAMLFTGCNANELENRCFPMMAAVDYDEEKAEVEFFYTFPKSGINSDNGQETANVAIMPVYDTDFGSARQTYENDLSLDADVNHLKVIILGKSFVERDEDFDLMIETLQMDESIPRNTYVVVVEDAYHYFELNDEMNNDIGSYIETLLEKKQREEDLQLVTVGDLMNQDTNAKENIPYLNINEIPGNN